MKRIKKVFDVETVKSNTGEFQQKPQLEGEMQKFHYEEVIKQRLGSRFKGKPLR